MLVLLLAVICYAQDPETDTEKPGETPVTTEHAEKKTSDSALVDSEAKHAKAEHAKAEHDETHTQCPTMQVEARLDATTAKVDQKLTELDALIAAVKTSGEVVIELCPNCEPDEDTDCFPPCPVPNPPSEE